MPVRRTSADRGVVRRPWGRVHPRRRAVKRSPRRPPFARGHRHLAEHWS